MNKDILKSVRILLLLFLTGLFACEKGEKQTETPVETDCTKVTYSGDIKAIINKSCSLSGCHNTGSGNGDFTTHAGLKAKSDNGTLRNRVLVKKDMPPSGALSSEELAKIDCWIKNGSPDN
jgi:hypothetical protein